MIIGITGKAGSGKSLLASMIKEILMKETKTEVEIVGFADEIKLWTSVLLNVGIEYLDTRLFKDSVVYGLSNVTGRQFLQRLGTEIGRNRIDPMFWINKVLLNYNPNKHLIIPDVRFLNEAEEIRKRGGLLIRKESSIRHLDSHVSETEMINITDCETIHYVYNKRFSEVLKGLKDQIENIILRKE